MFTNRKKEHYKQKVDVTQKKIWDLEFLRYQLRLQREGFRMEHDRIRETIDAATRRLEEEKKKEDPDKTICANMEGIISTKSKDVEQLKTQMAQVDLQVEGDSETQGINQSVESYHQVGQMLKEFIKTV